MTTLWRARCRAVAQLGRGGRSRALAGLRCLVRAVRPPVRRAGAGAASGAGLRLVNGYGPTEATIVTATGRSRPAMPRRGRIPIGTPVGQHRVFVLDRWLSPVPAGVAGSCMSAGAGLARGYLGRPG